MGQVHLGSIQHDTGNDSKRLRNPYRRSYKALPMVESKRGFLAAKSAHWRKICANYPKGKYYQLIRKYIKSQ